METMLTRKTGWIALATLALLTGAASFRPQFAEAQAVPPPPAAEPAAAPAAPAPEAPMAAPPAEPAPVAVMPVAAEPPPPAAVAAEPPPPPAAPAQTDDEIAKTPIGVHAWGRVGARMQRFDQPKKIDHLSSDGDLELHFDGNVTKEIGLTGNVAAVYGPTGTGGDIQGTVAILDLIARFDIVDEFHIWGGRMLVPSDRANFSGTWFEAPWYYPGTYSTHGFIGPHEGPYGRNDGATIWGQFGGGLFKYYLSAFDLWNGASKPLWSGRLNLSLLNPEPGYYHSSTYYGKDILAIAVGGQVQKNGSLPMTMAGMAPAGVDDYALFNADILFEKNLNGSGVFDLEGAVYKYVGDYEPFKFSYLVLASYMLPDATGPGTLQPLVRWQQAKSVATDKMDSSIEVQMGYVISQYSARVSLGFQHTDNSGAKGNGIYLGAQILK